MYRLMQRIGINRGAKLVNKINQLYREGDITRAEKLKRKVSKDSNKLYWYIIRARELRG